MPQIGDIKTGKEFNYKNGNKYIWHACIDCGKERWVMLWSGKVYRLRCKSCATKRRWREGKFPHPQGKHSWNWKGGRVKDRSGYILVHLTPDDFFFPMTNQRGYVREHRLIIARALGRNLHLWEIVHHKGAKYPKGSVEDKQDNRYPENLQLVSDDKHKQITIMENKIKTLEKHIALLEAENIRLREVSFS